jgi:hypothetical protein
MIKDKIQNEPVMTAASITPVIIAFFALLDAAGLPVEPGLQAAIITIVSFALPLALAWVARSKVKPMAKIEQELAAQALENEQSGG